MIDRIEIKETAKRIVKENMKKIWLGYIFVMAFTYLANELTNTLSSTGGSVIYKNAYFYATSSIYSNFLISMVINAIIAFILYGFSYCLLKIVRGQETNINDIFYFAPKFLPIFAIAILSTLLICTGMFLLIIPGIILSFSFAMLSYVYVDNKNISIIDTLKTSRELMKGYKFELFIFYLSFIGWAFLSVFTFGIALIWVIPYYLVSLTLFYEKIKSLKKPIDKI